MEKYKSYGTLSKTTQFPSVFCEAGVVQQYTEAQASVVQAKMGKVNTEEERELTSDATQVVKETSWYLLTTARQSSPPCQVAHPNTQNELWVQRGLRCRVNSVRANGRFGVGLQLRVWLVVAHMRNITGEASAAQARDGGQSTVLRQCWVRGAPVG